MRSLVCNFVLPKLGINLFLVPLLLFESFSLIVGKVPSKTAHLFLPKRVFTYF